jgi:hypothetical protein
MPQIAQRSIIKITVNDLSADSSINIDFNFVEKKELEIN